MAGIDAIAVLSDIHGNRWALEAVLQDIERRGIRRFINLGDCVYGPLDPAGTADLLISVGQRTVRGNEDRIIAREDSHAPVSPTLEYTRAQLKASHLKWLAGLPLCATIEPNILFFHGIPEHDDQYLLREVRAQGLRNRSREDLENLLQGINYPLILCGHDHLPGTMTLSDGRVVVNPGSVGLQAYTDDQPHDHCVSNGSPHARYAIVRRTDSGWGVDQVVVEYNWHSASETASANDRNDWAYWLRTGLAEQ